MVNNSRLQTTDWRQQTGDNHRQQAAGNRQQTTGGRRGSALIVVLWVVGLLGIIIGSFAFDAHVEARLTSYYRKRAKAGQLAISGIEVAQMLMQRGSEFKAEEMDEEEQEEDRWYQPVRQLAEGLAVRGLEEELGDGVIVLDIVPEPARLDINKLGKTDEDKEEALARILEVGGVPEEWWPELIESFLDWIDNEKPPVARVDGAETEDYYATLEEPYQAKDGPLDTVGELLLIKGFTREILYGGSIESEYDEDEVIVLSGIADLLTTHGDDKVNINATSMRVLMALPGVDEVVAGAIIEERDGWLDEEGERESSPFESVGDLFSRIPDLDPELKEYLTTDSQVYRITSTGLVQGVERKIWCIVKYENKALSIWQWREED